MNRFKSTLGIVALSLPIVLAGCAGSTQSPSSTSKASTNLDAVDTDALTDFSKFPNEPVTADTVTLTVTGMSCPMCATNLELELTDDKRLSDVVINLEDSSVRVAITGETRPTQLDLANIVHNAGYTLLAINE